MRFLNIPQGLLESKGLDAAAYSQSQVETNQHPFNLIQILDFPPIFHLKSVWPFLLYIHTYLCVYIHTCIHTSPMAAWETPSDIPIQVRTLCFLLKVREQKQSSKQRVLASQKWNCVYSH